MNLPNKITIFRFCCIPLLIACAYINFPYHWVATLIIYFVACVSDTVDGNIARKQKIVTDFGKLMDPLSDKSLVYSAFLILVNMGWHTDICIMLMLAREFLVSGIRMIAATTGEVIAANKFGKAKTFLQMASTGMTFLLLAIGEGSACIDMNTQWINIYCTVAFWIVTVVTVLSGIIYAKDGWHLIKTK